MQALSSFYDVSLLANEGGMRTNVGAKKMVHKRLHTLFSIMINQSVLDVAITRACLLMSY